MKIGIPEYRGRVSPVFDTCQRLLVFQGSNRGGLIPVEFQDWSCIPPLLRVDRLRQTGIDVLLCGGVSDWLARQVESQGIRLVPWLAGNVEDVLRAFADGGLPDRRFAMPGSWGKGRGWRLRRRGGRGNSPKSL